MEVAQELRQDFLPIAVVCQNPVNTACDLASHNPFEAGDRLFDPVLRVHTCGE
jgi:hypothetical protein